MGMMTPGRPAVKSFLLRLWGRLALPSWIQWAISWLAAQKFLVGVSAVIQNQEGKVLLCKHTYRSIHPWGLPGGGLHRSENPSLAVEREVLEETGFEVRARQLLAVKSSQRHPHVGLFYLCEWTGGTFRPSAEVSEARFYDVDALPQGLLSAEAKTLREVIKQLQRPTHTGTTQAQP